MARLSVLDSTGYSGLVDAEANFVELYADVASVEADVADLQEGGIDLIASDTADAVGLAFFMAIAF